MTCLHDLLSNASGKVILEKCHALAQHIAMILPASPIGQTGGQSQIDDGASTQQGCRPDEHDHHRHPDQTKAMSGHEFGALGIAHPIENAAKIDIDVKLAQGGYAG